MTAVGIDVGGTFTDLVAVSPDGRVIARKVPSTPRDQSEGVLDALRALGEPSESLTRIVHGTTVATNTLLERTGARVVLCATAGVTDLLELRRQDRASLYDLTRHHPAPLVPPDRTVAVEERIEPGQVTRELSPSSARDAAGRVAAMQPDAVAIALLHSYERPEHEQQLADAIGQQLPDIDVVTSADTHPEIREYERTATTVAEAYLRPRIASYLSRLGQGLAARGAPAPSVMTSSGGTRRLDHAARSAAALALSGPAGGVAGAAAVARAAGFEDALTIDIGGTSADAGLILGGRPLIEPGGSIAGVPIALPRVLVETVSAGGGSVGWIDSGSVLRVGPRSAGIDPGPAAFGRGGREATVTDAHLALGHLRESMLGGGLTLHREAALAAIATLAERLHTTVERTAEAMIAIADAAMARALRRVSVERGVDPRDCVLVAFGGGGPLHGCGLAEHLGMTRVLVPPHAGVLSALGMAIAPEAREAAASVMQRTSMLDAGALRAIREGLAARAAVGAPEGATPRWTGRVRYVGQGHELDVAIEPSDDGLRLADRFIAAHRTRYGFVLARPVEVVSARCVIAGEPLPLRLESTARDEGGVDGPRVLALPDATLLIASGWRGAPLPVGGWLLERAT